MTKIHRPRSIVDALTCYTTRQHINASRDISIPPFGVRVSPLPPLHRNSTCALQYLISPPFVIRDRPPTQCVQLYCILLRSRHNAPQPPGMPRKEWTTPKQKQFLQAELPRYNNMVTKEYNRHFPTFFQDWCKRWPERATAFPELAVNTLLTSKQEETLAEALSKRRDISNATQIRLSY